MTLAEFLLARIAEDEAVATDAKDDHADADGHWWWDGVDFEGSWPTSEPPKDDKSYAFQSWEVMAERLDPARVLAECEAKRRIVELHAPVIPVSPFSKCGHPGCDQSHSEKRLPPACPTCPTSDVDGACETLYTLAIPYVDHPDYRDEWRP